MVSTHNMKIACDKCNQSGKLESAVHHIIIECYICDGTGHVSPDRPKWIEIGKRLKSERLKHRMTLYREAKRLGIGIIEYSDIEQGKIDNTKYDIQ